MGRVGVAVGKLDGVVGTTGGHEGVADVLLDHHATQRLGAVGDLLGEVDDVGRDAKGLGAGPVAGAAETGDHLVKNQQDVVRRADLAQALQIALGRNDHAGRTGERLDDHGRDVGGVVQADHVEQLVGQLGAGLGHAPRKRAVGGLGVGQVIGLDALAKVLAVAQDAAHRNATEVHAVVALEPPDQAGLARLAAHAPVSTGHLQGGVGRLGAGAGEEHAVEAGGHALHDLVGQLERQRVGEVERGRVVQRGDLLAHRLHDLLAPMAQAAAPQTGQAVEHLAAIGGRVIRALTAHDQARVLLELAVAREGHPVGGQPVGVGAGGGLLQLLGIAEVHASAFEVSERG